MNTKKKDLRASRKRKRVSESDLPEQRQPSPIPQPDPYDSEDEFIPTPIGETQTGEEEKEEDEYIEIVGPMFVSDDSDSEEEDEETESIPLLLYPGATQTRDAFLVEWVGDCVRRNVSDAAADVLYETVRNSFPANNSLPRTYKTARKRVEEITGNNIVLSHTTICNQGHIKDVCTCQYPKRSCVTIFDVDKQIAQVKERLSTEIANYEAEMANTIEHADSHQGQLYREAKNKGLEPVALYTDGGRYAKSGVSECWVVVLFLMCLPPKLRHSYHNAIFVGTWFGVPKPNWPVFLDYLEFEKLSKKVSICQLIADIPARQALLNMKNVPGYSTCAKCEVIGTRQGATSVTFPLLSEGSEVKRTSDHFKHGIRDGMNGISALCNYLVLPRVITTDVMHSFYAGCIRDDIKRMKNGYAYQAGRILSMKQKYWHVLDTLIERNRVVWPMEIERTLRKTQNLGYWKGTEWKYFILYIIPAFATSVIERAGAESNQPQVKVMRNKQAYSLLRISSALRILVQEKIGTAAIQIAEKLLFNWRRERTEVWSAAANTFKSHEADHLIEQVREHGPLQTHSAFGGESIVGRIGRLITCRTDTVSSKQIRERLNLERSTTEWARKYGEERIKDKFVPGSQKHVWTHTVPVRVRDVIGNTVTAGSVSYGRFTLRPNSNDSYIAYQKTDNVEFGKVVAIVENRLIVSRLRTANFNERISADYGADIIDANCYKWCAYLEVFKDSDDAELVEVEIKHVAAKCIKFDIEDNAVLVVMPHAFEHS